MLSRTEPQVQGQVQGPLRIYLNSLQSEYTRAAYRIYINKYLQTTGYKGIEQFLCKAKTNPKQIEDELIEFIIAKGIR